MRTSDPNKNRSAFTRLEALVVLVILLIISSLVVRVIYRDEIRQIDLWMADALGFSPRWITVPLIVTYVLYHLQSHWRAHRRTKDSQKRRLELPSKR
jgi:hypothetical protein